MSGRNPRPGEEESFLQRWARLKRESHVDAVEPEAAAPATPAAPEAEAAGAETLPAAPCGEDESARPAAEAEGAPELPPIDSLSEESDFGVFMKPGVDPALRRLALRKMWGNPKYQVVDELDPFRADFAAFTALGDTITSDMKFHAERLLRREMEKAAEAAGVSGATGEERANVAPVVEADESAAAVASGDAEETPDKNLIEEDGDERREA